MNRSRAKPSTSSIVGRYLLHDRLGVGGMGVVYRATDRLTGYTVALKQVTAPTKQLQFASRGAAGDTDTLRLALANEFQTLASLRHPNIISVLDYGFDAQRQPYFTMEYLHNAQPILQAGAEQPAETQVDLLVQLLQALAYLHRRGILHRDLKPGNVLVAQGTVRALDFGLSVARGQANGTVGSFTYMAPEVLAGEPAVEASDLYAVGVIAYELFAGRHPFATADAGQLIQDILSVSPDLTALEVNGRLVPVVARLLEKEPAARYPSADACIAAFSHALGQAPPQESIAIRESYLQAAEFVGREAEMEQLAGALEQAMNGQGSAWLVGGESGVGKSRLLDELRTLALVKGALVLFGQGVSGGGLSYQLWRDPLRRLALTAELSDLETGVLGQIVPDVGILLDRRIPDVPTLEGPAGQQRLFSAITDLFRRQETPMLLILEDLHWADESIQIFRQLNRIVTSLPLLIVGSYRDDEAPALLAELPGARALKLERLSKVDIAELSVSMLGQDGRQPEILALLQRETEGNAFFLVEVVRALAERAGRLSSVRRLTLPTHIFPQGIQTIVQRRLERVPAPAWALLRLAAVAGRQVDLRVLAHLSGGINLDDWLTTCLNAAVLEMRDRSWRFTHDKLREGLLATLESDEQVPLHRQVAKALEQTYPDDPRQAAALAYHWSVAGDMDKERRYARLAGEHAAAQFANDEAITHLTRALHLTPETDTAGRYALLLAREKVYDMQGDREFQAQDLEMLVGILEGVEQQDKVRTIRQWAEVALRRANYAQVTSDFPAAIEAARRAIGLAQQVQDVNIEAAGYMQWGLGLWRLADFEACRSQLERALTLAQVVGSRQLEADSLRYIGNVYYYLGAYAEAVGYWEQALPISREIGDRPGEASALGNLGEAARSQGDYAQAKAYYEQRLRICREIGERNGENIALLNVGLVSHNLGDDKAARQYSQQALWLAQEIGNRSHQGYSLTNLGYALMGLGNLAEAADAYRQVVTLRRELGEHHLAMEAIAGLARVSLAQGNALQAQAWVEEILSYLEGNTLDGTEEPFRVYHTCYRALRANQDPRAQAILDTAHRQLQERAAKITNEELRRLFLENVVAHREIVSEWCEAR